MAAKAMTCRKAINLGILRGEIGTIGFGLLGKKQEKRQEGQLEPSLEAP